jgi:DNA-binding beta-propeller fold protein YncE
MPNYTSKISSKISFLLFLGLVLAGCEPNEPTEPPAADFATGVYVCNEGIYSQTSGTISHYNPDTKQLRAGGCLFRSVNSRDLGNVVQSMQFWNDKAYIVVNNSNKIEVVNAENWQESAQITGLQQPRYILPVDEHILYVSQWGNDGLTGEIKVIQIPENQIIASIPTYKGAELMFLHNSQAWISHTGGYDYDNRLAILNTNSHTLAHTINLPADVPNSIAKDAQNHLWVSCMGKTIYSNFPEIDSASSTASALICIDPDTRQILRHIRLDIGGSARHLQSDASGNTLFYSYRDGVYRFDIASEQSQRIISGNFYGLGFDKAKNELYAGRNAGISAAQVLRLTPQGTAIDSFLAGVFVNGIYFR